MTQIKVEFAPGCFDDWEGTQQELDDLVSQLRSMAESGELMDQSELVNPDDLSDEILVVLNRRAQYGRKTLH